MNLRIRPKKHGKNGNCNQERKATQKLTIKNNSPSGNTRGLSGQERKNFVNKDYIII